MGAEYLSYRVSSARRFRLRDLVQELLVGHAVAVRDSRTQSQIRTEAVGQIPPANVLEVSRQYIPLPWNARRPVS